MQAASADGPSPVQSISAKPSRFQQRWILADAQIDDVQREWVPLDFDVTDVPGDRFVIAGQAWAQSRAGRVDPGESLAGLRQLMQAPGCAEGPQRRPAVR